MKVTVIATGFDSDSQGGNAVKKTSSDRTEPKKAAPVKEADDWDFGDLFNTKR